MKIITITSLLVLLASVAFAQEYSIDWYVIASGGGHSESENYQSDGTAGQPIVGQSSSENYTVNAGYWVIGEPSGGDCVYIPGDCDYNGEPAALPDVIAMIGMYRGTVVHPYECDCPPHGETFGATADPNGNCIPDELPDVVAEIGIYRGTVEALGCSDCPGSGRLLVVSGDQPSVIPTLKTKIKINPKSTAE